MSNKTKSDRSPKSEPPARPTPVASPTADAALPVQAAAAAGHGVAGLLRAADLPALQRVAGNQAVQRLLQRPPSARAASVIARKPADVARGKAAAEAAKLAGLAAVATRASAENTALTAAATTICMQESQAKLTEIERQSVIFEAAAAVDKGCVGWRSLITMARTQATAAVGKAREMVQTKTTAEATLAAAEKAEKTAEKLKDQAYTNLAPFQKMLSDLRAEEQQVYVASTTEATRAVASTVIAKADKASAGQGLYVTYLGKIEAAEKTATSAVTTISTALVGSPLSAKAHLASQSAQNSLALMREVAAVVDVMNAYATQAKVRVERVAKAKETADQKAEAARQAQLDADKQAQAIKDAEAAAKQFDALAQQAQAEAQRVGDLQRAAAALAQAEADALVSAKTAAAKTESDIANADKEAEPYYLEDMKDGAEADVSSADTRAVEANEKAATASAAKDEADLDATTATTTAAAASAKASDPVTLQNAATAATTAATQATAATTAASDRDAAVATTQTQANDAVRANAQTERLRALVGGQLKLNELLLAVPKVDELEALLTDFGYASLKKLLEAVGGGTQLAALRVIIPDDVQLEKLVTHLGYPLLNTYLALPLTPKQIDDLIVLVPYKHQLETLMTTLGYARLDLLMKLPDATAQVLYDLTSKAKDGVKVDTLVATLGYVLLKQFLGKYTTITQLETFITAFPDVTKRTAVFTACAGDPTLLTNLLAKTANDAAGTLGLWLSGAGGHKATALLAYLSDSVRSGDPTRIWDSTQTIAAASVPITGPRAPHGAPPLPVPTLDQIMAVAVPMEGASVPAYNGYAGNRTWGASVKPGDGVLPQYTASGGAITYIEYDIHPYTGAVRGAQRVIVGSDGRRYYTADHYEHFSLIS